MCIVEDRTFWANKERAQSNENNTSEDKEQKKRNRKAVFQKVHQKEQFLRKLKLIIKASHTSRTIIEEDFSTDLLEISFYVTIEYILIHLSSDNFLGTLMMVSGNIV